MTTPDDALRNMRDYLQKLIARYDAEASYTSNTTAMRRRAKAKAGKLRQASQKLWEVSQL